MQHQEQATMHGKPRKKRRVFLWVFLAIQVIFLVWLIVGISSVAHSHDCTGLTPAECTSAKQVGGTIGAGLVVALWVATDVILGIGRFIVLTARHNRGNQ